MAIFTKYKDYLDRFEDRTDLNKWGFDNNTIYRIFMFADFNQAILFVNSLANLANEIDHHPDILLYDYKFVKVSFKSHDKNKVTNDDYKSAHLVDKIYDGESL